jgi:Na+/melibiose symporter-like transporter
MVDPRTIQDIQYALAPAIMVSSSALLLLGFQAKFSSVASRFRALTHEKRLLSLQVARDEPEESRLRSLTEQVNSLMRRATYVKHAILLSYVGIVCFAGTSVLIFLNVYWASPFHHAVIAVFMTGLACLLISALLMILETQLLHKALTLEKGS